MRRKSPYPSYRHCQQAEAVPNCCRHKPYSKQPDNRNRPCCPHHRDRKVSACRLRGGEAEVSGALMYLGRCFRQVISMCFHPHNLMSSRVFQAYSRGLLPHCPLYRVLQHCHQQEDLIYCHFCYSIQNCLYLLPSKNQAMNFCSIPLYRTYQELHRRSQMK